MIVHLGWIGPMTDRAKLAADRIARSLPNDVVRFHTSEDLILPAWRRPYERIRKNPHMASDFLRHSVLRRWPGLWLDLDVTLRVSPANLAAAWDKYTVLKISGTGWAGTDVIYVPESWPNWGMVDDYIAGYDFSQPLGYLAFAHDMITAMWQRNRSSVAVIDDASLYPCRKRDVTHRSQVLRCGLSQTLGVGGTVAANGPGTALKKLLASIGITASPQCRCNKRAALMDARGCDWCESNIDTIVQWLREEAASRGLPFLDAAAKMLVRRAIRNARKEASRARPPGSQVHDQG